MLPFFLLPLSTVENLSSVESSTMLSFLSMSKMKMTGNAAVSWNSTIPSVVGQYDPRCCAVLSANVTEFELLLCLGLVEAWQEHLLMVYNLLVSTMVLLEDLDRDISWRACSHNDVVVGKVLHAWCQLWRCSRGTWRTSPSIRSPPETPCFVILPSAQHRGVVAASSYSSFCVNGFCMVHLPLVMSVLFPRDRVTAVR